MLNRLARLISGLSVLLFNEQPPKYFYVMMHVKIWMPDHEVAEVRSASFVGVRRVGQPLPVFDFDEVQIDLPLVLGTGVQPARVL